MPVKLVPTEVADVPQIARTEAAAFSPSEHSQVLFPGGGSKDAIEKRVNRIRTEWKGDPSMRLFNAIDTDTGEIVGAARWHVYLKERPESEWMKEDVPENWGEAANGPACKEFFGAIHESRRRLMAGNPHICMQIPLFNSEPPNADCY
jgi:hypothetical protein